MHRVHQTIFNCRALKVTRSVKCCSVTLKVLILVFEPGSKLQIQCAQQQKIGKADIFSWMLLQNFVIIHCVYITNNILCYWSQQ